MTPNEQKLNEIVEKWADNFHNDVETVTLESAIKQACLEYSAVLQTALKILDGIHVQDVQAIAELQKEFDRERQEAFMLYADIKAMLDVEVIRGDQLRAQLAQLKAVAKELYNQLGEFHARCNAGECERCKVEKQYNSLPPEIKGT